jgi:hypothetical protein
VFTVRAAQCAQPPAPRPANLSRMSGELEVVATAASEAEAAIISARLTDAGLRSMEQATGTGGSWAPTSSIEIYVAAEDLERARAALDPSAAAE